jgi:prepilin-type N-terminal cleavage/methylation domain-containing protein
MSRLYYSMRRLSGNSTGFTLLEILIVIALAGVIVSLSIPDFNKVIPEMRVIRAAQKLATDIKLAQQKAVSEMSVVNFHVETGQNRYFAMVRDRNSPLKASEDFFWWRDYYDDYVEDPLNSGAYLLVDFDEQSSSRFRGVQITSITAGFYAVSTYGFYMSPLGDMRWPFSNTIITITDPASGYSRQVQVSYPMAKVTVLP